MAWCGAVLQTEQYSGGGAVLQQYSGVGLSAVAGWGCFAVSIRRNCYTLQILVYEERRDGAVSRVVCSVLFFVLLRHVIVMLLSAMPSGYKLVITYRPCSQFS